MKKQINVFMSAFNKTLLFQHKGTNIDISNLVPEDVWRIGNRNFPLNPLDDWRMRKEIRKIFIEYFKQNIDANLNEDDVVF